MASILQAELPPTFSSYQSHNQRMQQPFHPLAATKHPPTATKSTSVSSSPVIIDLSDESSSDDDSVSSSQHPEFKP